jgi:hypothetical protein
MEQNENQFGTTPGTGTQSTSPQYEPHPCPTCGEQHAAGTTEAGFEAMLGKLGLSDDAIAKMRTSLENLDMEAYFNHAKEYLGRQAVKARDYTREHKAAVGAAVGVAAVAAGVLIALKMRGEKGVDLEQERDRV